MTPPQPMIIGTTLLLLLAVLIQVSCDPPFVFAQNTSTTTAAASSSNTTTTPSPVTASVTPPPPPTTTSSSLHERTATDVDSDVVGRGAYYEPNTTLHPHAGTCLNLLSTLSDPETHKFGATTHSSLCIPTTVESWILVNSTRSVNRKPSSRDVLDCAATCSEKRAPRKATVSIIYMFGQCYCYDSDFNSRLDHNKECCKDGLLYEEYYMNKEQQCNAKMFGSVYTTTLLCPVNGSLCGAQPASQSCETREIAIDDEYYASNGVAKASGGKLPDALCCIPKGSMREYSSWGLAVAQYTIVFICVLALFQVLYWIMRKRREDDDDNDSGSGGGTGGRSSRDQPRLLIVPMAEGGATSPSSSSSAAAAAASVTVTQAGRTHQQAIAAAKEIMGLFPVLTPEQIGEMGDPHDEDGSSCSICIDPLINAKAIRMNVCGHCFHYNCALTYMAHKLSDRVRQVTCPMCRVVIVDASVNDEANNNNGGSSSPAAAVAASPSSSNNGSQSPTRGGAAPAAASSSSSPAGSRGRGASQRGRSANPLLEESLLGVGAGSALESVEMVPQAAPPGRSTAAQRSSAAPLPNGFVTSSLL